MSFFTFYHHYHHSKEDFQKKLQILYFYYQNSFSLPQFVPIIPQHRRKHSVTYGEERRREERREEKKKKEKRGEEGEERRRRRREEEKEEEWRKCVDEWVYVCEVIIREVDVWRREWMRWCVWMNIKVDDVNEWVWCKIWEDSEKKLFFLLVCLYCLWKWISICDKKPRRNLHVNDKKEANRLTSSFISMLLSSLISVHKYTSSITVSSNRRLTWNKKHNKISLRVLAFILFIFVLFLFFIYFFTLLLFILKKKSCLLAYFHYLLID